MASRSSTALAPAWKSHPIYPLRRGLLINDAIGAFLTLISMTAHSEWDLSAVIFDVLLLGASTAFILWDLITFSQQQSSLLPSHEPGLPQHLQEGRKDDEDKVKWPRLALLIWDIIFAFAFQWMFWITLASIHARGYYYDVGPIVLQAYAALTILIASILHAWSFWKELMARKQQSWERKLARQTCPQCGVHPEPPPTPEHTAALVRSLNDNVKQKLAQLLRRERSNAADVERADSEEVVDTEESLLITPDEPSASSQKGYGAVDDISKAMEASAETIVKKKGKARMVDA